MTATVHPPVLIYRIDDENRITSVNSSWNDFARSNQGEAVMPDLVLGRKLLECVSNNTIRELYLQLIIRARAGKPACFHYRCDAPDKRRTFEMRIQQVPDGEVEFSSALLHEEMRTSVELLESGTPRSDKTLRVCSWCQQVAMPDDRWLPVENAVEELHLLEIERLPGITHGICPPCLAKMQKQLI